MKTLQLFTDQAIAQGQQLSSLEILKFLEDFRVLHGGKNPDSENILLLAEEEFKGHRRIKGTLIV